MENPLIKVFQSLNNDEIQIEDISLTKREIRTVIIGLRVLDAFDDALDEALGLDKLNKGENANE